MREIKFRGKRKDNGEWVVGKHIVLNGRHLITVNGNDNPNYSCGLLSNRQVDALHTVEVIPETVGQYTGLKDKNGKEIYEGDKIAAKNVYVPFDKIIGTIVFDKDDSCWVVEWMNGNGIDIEGRRLFTLQKPTIEIIGNIYENPELFDEKILK
jgi:uncharacterized phage protein (TIGR01671 family)